MIRVLGPVEDDLARTLSAMDGADVTYPEVGATRGDLPAGYRHDRYERVLGHGPGVFAVACDGLREWACHEGAGLARLPVQPELREGLTLVQALPVGPARFLAACRIVYVIDEPRTFGFAYGTLPLHPEQGEEAFVASLDEDGAVRLRIIVFSKPRHPLARLGWFVGRQIQVRVTNRFLDGLEQYVRSRT